ncbi:MAG: hypothetical protein AB1791_10320 [Chloroflexota bacterium]
MPLMPVITQETVQQQIWPVIAGLIQATLDEDDRALRKHLVPGEAAAEMLDLFSSTVFDILLKTILGREQVALARAIEVDGGRHVFVEFAWLDPAAGGRNFTPDDVVAVKVRRHRQGWRIVEVNPSTVEMLLTAPRAQTILAATKALDEKGELPAEPWILPLALYSGALQLPLRDGVTQDPVEALLLPGLQQRGHSVLTLVAGRWLWREYRKKGEKQELDKPAAWAAAVEFVMSEQAAREVTQAAVGQFYQVSLAALLPRVNQIKRTLHIQGLDERYTTIQTTHVIVKEEERGA